MASCLNWFKCIALRVGGGKSFQTLDVVGKNEVCLLCNLFVGMFNSLVFLNEYVRMFGGGISLFK